MSTHRLYVAVLALWYTGLNTHGVCACVCVYARICTRIPLPNAVCPPWDLPSPGSCHPLVPGSHGDMASGCHHNLQAPSERSCGTNDGMEKVFRTDCAIATHSIRDLLPWSDWYQNPRPVMYQVKKLQKHLKNFLSHIYSSFGYMSYCYTVTQVKWALPTACSPQLPNQQCHTNSDSVSC